MIGADGARSTVMKNLDISMQGFRYDRDWELYDIEIDMPISRDEGHIRIFDDGGMIMIRLKENVWRVAGNMKDVLNFLPDKSITGKVIWKSNFRITHGVARELNRKNIFLIGDAAHLHSPVGARGMNLGIEDAWLLSKLIAENQPKEYAQLRRKYIEKTVSRISTVTQFLAGENFASRTFRKNISLTKPFIPLVAPMVSKFILGLNK